MTKPLFKYITNEKEESALMSLCSFLKIDEDEFFETTKYFMESKKYFIDTEVDFARQKGFGQTRLQNLRKVYQRIIGNIEIAEIGFHSEYEHSLTNKRYEGLAIRNFDRLIFEKFHCDVFFKIYKSWTFGIGKNDLKGKDEQLKSMLEVSDYIPDTHWITYELSLDNQIEIKKIYDDMKVVRFRNILMTIWEKLHDKNIKQLFKEYVTPKYFGKTLPQHDFVIFYGQNNTNRKCTYCNISESDIAKLQVEKKIYTKRIYSRGTTMEVDKRDPQKGYQLDNLVMSCYWCNNAKTDEFDENEFMEIGAVISKIWQNRLK